MEDLGNLLGSESYSVMSACSIKNLMLSLSENMRF